MSPPRDAHGKFRTMTAEEKAAAAAERRIRDAEQRDVPDHQQFMTYMNQFVASAIPPPSTSPQLQWALPSPGMTSRYIPRKN